MKEFSELNTALASLRDHTNSSAGVLENMVISVSPGSVVIEANRSGLLELARQILLVASKDISGAHQDFDKAGFASRADAALTISLNNTLK